uniref:[histone H3]-lysine(36) N-trimethyltransferase n=1 Tax=Sinocyclocheilus anshuiensis TaxID=1608454 RepID=A0A671M4R4_9TELE
MVVLTNHLLPKGTKAKVNLEEQGRQKVSFSFAQTKKPRQNVFLAPPSPEKYASEHSSALQAGPVPTPDLAGQSDETKNVDTNTPAVGETQTAPAPLSFPLKSKPVLGKMHFKKQILSVTVVEDNSIVSTASAEISEPVGPSESDKIRYSAKVETETSLQQSHKNSVIDSSSEKVLKEENPQEKVDSCLKVPVSSHIGKGDKDTSIISEHEENRKSQPRSDCTLPGSESDGDSIRTSSSQKSSDRRNKIKSECPSNEAKRSSNSKTEESEKSRHDRKEDEKGSSRSKSERDSRHTSSRSSRSDRDRRRTKSRSRSRSRGCRTSSYSRSERSRSERQSRSDRSHYHDSERRFHRSSPHRERRGSRSRTDGRSRDSSDSEDDHRRTRTRGSDSSRSSTYSSSQKDSKLSIHSRSHRDSKPTDCSRSSESDKRTQHSKSERSHLKAGDSESNRRSSPDAETVHRKSSAHSKSEINAKTSNSNPATSSRTSEEKVHKNSSDSDEEHRKKRQSQGSDRSSVSGTSSSKKTDSTDHKTLNNVTGTERQSKDRSSNNTKQSQLALSPVTPQKECSKIDDNSTLPKSKCISQRMHEATHKVNLFKTKQQTEQQAPNQELSSLGKCTNVPESHKTTERLKESTSTTSRSLEVRSSTDEPGMKNEIPIQSKALAEGPTDSFCVGHTPNQDSVGSLADPLSVKELPPGGCLKFNTKLDGPSHITQSAQLCEKDSEQHYVNPEQPSSGILKKDGSAKKSRWDIVGQVTSEYQIVNPDVEKFILVKRIELNNDTTPEESCTQKQDSEVPSKKSVEEQIQDTTSAESHQKVSSRASDLETQHTHGELIKQIVEDPQSTSAPVVSDLPLNCSSGSKEKINVDKPKPETQDPDSLNHDGKWHSEDSESEESDSDSDDGRVSLKRLHSVVVVPKNSTIALETNDLTEPSPGCLVFSGQQQTDTHESINREFAYGFSNQSKLEESSAALFKASVQAAMLNPDIKHVSYQSQSNMVDSTSHSEATIAHVYKNWSAQERPNSVQINQASLQSFEKTSRPQSDHHQNHDRPDSWNGRKGGKQHYGESTDFNSGKGYGLAWDFNQSEQPSSTFQQPDSSHGTEHPPQPGIALFDSGHRQGPWTQPAISKTNRPVNAHVPFQYHDSVNQIHPDSLTNDHDEDRVVGNKQGSVLSADLPGSSPFVQAHEISSNCSFTTESQNISEAPREDNQKPHRGRGPPKKRRQEFESESDNEAEAGLSSKRECLDESSRVVKDGKESFHQIQEVVRPLLSLKNFVDPAVWREKAKQKKMPPYFDLIEDNVYLTERKKNKSHRDIKRMQCECAILSREERAQGMMACGEDCLNRLLMIECSSRCLNGAYCSNRRFQMKQHADFEVILTETKGWGLRAAKDLQPNTFVLEYCGEVLDHREFKARVKEYARNKNIHYYFMALKNNEIIDATLKGNCSRFMNHSCEPNCETQKWTVNGQLRVGFFTTKAVTAGAELTFDYQFQRYGKEAQKCFCGAPSCRGLIGGETRVSVRAAGGKKQRDRSRKKDTDSALTTLDEELEALQENGEGLCGEKDVISLCRLMVRVETMEQRLTCLKLIQNTQNPLCLKQFLDHHGLSLLWIFMVELSEAKSNSVNNIKLQLEIMKALAVLPISTKNMLEESRVLQFIQRWAQSRPLSQPAEQDGYSSESTSRAQTPLNTPDGPPAKLASELDGDTPKRAVYRRLKIISENSLDSAMSDASKASDGKEEEEDEEEEEMEDETSQLEATIEREVKVENSEAPSESQAELEPELKQEPPETEEVTHSTPEDTGSEGETLETQEPEEKPIVKPEEQLEDEKIVEETKSEEPSESQTESTTVEDAPSVTDTTSAADIINDVVAEVETPMAETQVENASSEQCSSEGNESCSTAEITPTQPSETIMESVSSESTAVAIESAPTESPSASVETTPPESVAVSTENISSEAVVAAGSADATALAIVAVPAEGAAVGTPSQDEEEGVSDVESERSQEPQVQASDIIYRIPKKSQVEKESSDRSRDREALMTPRTPSSSRERERERDKERDRDRDRDWERDRERDGERSSLRSADRKRRRGSTSPLPPSAYERGRRNDDRYEQSSSKKKLHTKESRNKLSTEERRKLFEQEVAQREAQKQQQQQQQQQQQLQTLAFNPLAYTSSPNFMAYPPGYPIQTYVDPTNPNAGKVLLPTPAVEPLCVTPAPGTFEQTPTQPIISELNLASPSSTTTQAGPASSLAHIPASLELSSGTQTQQFVQPAVPAQDPNMAVLSVPTQIASPQIQGQQGYTTLWDPNTQQAVTVQTQPTQQYSTTAQPQTAIYYQGQPCQTIYSIPAGYPQTNTPVIQTYTEPAASYLHGQQVYTGHQQGVVVQQGGTVTTIVTSQTVQQEMIVPNSIIDLPPPSPPKPKTIILPPSWKVARDPEGRIYYYHIITRQTQWDPPSWDGTTDEASEEHEAEMDLGTPTYDENPSKFSTKTAEADTSSELAKKSKEVFRKEMSQFIVQCLNPYRKPDCMLGRISNTEDFKHLARKLTHGVMNKELKSCKNPEDLECNENVKHKTKEYIKKYMQKFGAVYRPKEDIELD